ncbi:histidine kinase OS=Streptomyces microflavus OX=1919 GN=Smic_43100 PE=4 SV=1 [Streptomyces microflavus]
MSRLEPTGAHGTGPTGADGTEPTGVHGAEPSADEATPARKGLVRRFRALRAALPARDASCQSRWRSAAVAVACWFVTRAQPQDTESRVVRPRALRVRAC